MLWGQRQGDLWVLGQVELRSEGLSWNLSPPKKKERKTDRKIERQTDRQKERKEEGKEGEKEGQKEEMETGGWGVQGHCGDLNKTTFLLPPACPSGCRTLSSSPAPHLPVCCRVSQRDNSGLNVWLCKPVPVKRLPLEGLPWSQRFFTAIETLTKAVTFSYISRFWLAWASWNYFCRNNRSNRKPISCSSIVLCVELTLSPSPSHSLSWHDLWHS